MKYTVSEKRANFLRNNFFEYSFTKEGLDKKALDLISEPIELDFIAKNHNYDDGNEVLIQLISNANIDISTVKMIFFRSDLNIFIENSEKSEDSILINSILNNFKNNFYSHENFYYNPKNDIEVLEFNWKKIEDLVGAQNILFSEPKGKLVEPNFAENFHKRNISNMKVNFKIVEKENSFKFETKGFLFEYHFLNRFKNSKKKEIENFINLYKFPEYLFDKYGVTEKQLKKVISTPQMVIDDQNCFVVLYIFNSKSLLLKNALTNVSTMMRNEFSNIQGFFKIEGVETDFDKIKRIKHFDHWFALSCGMQIKISNSGKLQYLKLLMLQKEEFVFSFSIISDNLENINNEFIHNTVIENISII